MEISFPVLRFHAFHGVLPEEQEVGGDFEVGVTLHVRDAQAHGALFADRLQDTVNYAEAYELIRQEMTVASALLEHVAARIAKKILRKFRLVAQADVAVTKCCPPIKGYCGKGVTVSFSLKRRLVVWDFDGTIADTAPGIVRTMTATFKKLDWAVPNEKDIRLTIGLPLIKSIAQLAPSKSKEEVAAATDLYRELFEEVGTLGVTLFPGIDEVFRRQHEEGFFTAIATSRGHQSASELCEKLGIRQYVDFIVGCEDVPTHKPDPTPVLLLYDMANVQPQDATVVGDTTFDILMGLNARAGRVLGVGWGNHSASRLLEAGAMSVVTRASELAPAVLTSKTVSL